MGTFLVTGSASGMGRAIRELLVGQGAEVIGVDQVDADVVADLATAAGRADAVAAARCLATDGIDGCVVAAGLGPHERPVERIVAVNLFGALGVLDGVLDLLASRGGTAVAICSNSAGITPIDVPGLLEAMAAEDEPTALRLAAGAHGAVAYGASKLALGRALRRRVGRWGGAGVRLNGVAPGPVRTPLLQGTLDDPELGPLVAALPVPWGEPIAAPIQVAGIVAFLLSAASAPVHGSILLADGGTDALLRPDHV